MKRVLYTFVFCALILNPLYSNSSNPNFSNSSNKEIDLKNINSQIRSLENLKDYYLAKATRLRNRADRLQFNSREDGLPEAQKYWNLADKYDRMADQIQDEIDKLKAEEKSVHQKEEY